MKPRLIIGILIAGALIVALWASHLLIAITDRAYICENTGSRKGHREWFFGAHTKNWYHQSELERYMEVAHPDLLKHRWTSYAGDGRSLIPGLKSSGHGRPGPILLLPSDQFDEYVSSLSTAQRLELYEILSTGSKEAVEGRINSIFEESTR